MPNWPLSMKVQTYLINHAVMLSNRKLQYAQSDFPLTTAQIQFSIMEEEKVHTLRRYIDEGTKTIEKHRQLRIALLRDKIPGLPRGTVLQVTLPDWVVVERSTHYGISSTKFQADESHYLVPDFSEERLTVSERQALVNWVKRAVRQHRMHKLITATVNQVVTKHALTIAHMQQLWPMLCTFMNSDPEALNARYQGDRVFYAMWRDRFRAPVRPMQRYNPTPEVVAKFGKIIHHADIVLAAGMMLAPYTPDRKVVTAEVEHYETLDGDITI